VTATRFDPPPQSTLPAESTWRIDIAAGVINDQLPTILYLRQSDPRGWVLGPDYVETEKPRIGDVFVERDALDDADDPPFLVVSDPPTTTVSSPTVRPDFVRVPDAQRPALEAGAFCSEEDWTLDLWRASVILTAAPIRSSYFAAELPAPSAVKFRLYTSGAKPVATFAASSGGWLELATLYLLRDPKDPLGTAEIRVRQREFYPFWNMTLQPGGQLVTLLDAAAQVFSGPPGFADLLRNQLEDTLSGAASSEFWTV
jgi:hypothetical protein